MFYSGEAGATLHNYSTHARGLNPLVGTYRLLDLVPRGRNEDGLAFTMAWVRRHDQYGDDYVPEPAAGYEKPREMDACWNGEGRA